uniref:Uncharacterized protein n=1 Tax=Romanomermis culicivorax TaxID=13658 RepID=A0A915JJN1_ROMCU
MGLAPQACRLRDAGVVLGLQIGRSDWRTFLGVEIGGQGFVADYWISFLRGLAVIYVLRSCNHIVESISPEASLCMVVAAEVVPAAAVENRRTWEAALKFAGGDQLRLCGRDSGPVIGLCYGGGQNGN